MVLKLHNIDPSSLFSDHRKAVLYGDFNVLNYLYEQDFIQAEDIIIYPDSTAVYLLLKYFYRYKVTKLVSTDIQEVLFNSLSGKRIFLFGDSDYVLSRVKLIFNSTLQFSGTMNGYNYNEETVCEYINRTATDVLFVGLGASRQEKWILNNYNNLNVKLIISVGGWFQYLTGLKKRAPEYLRNAHLEWIYKLIKEFRRVWKRYFVILPVFILRILTGSIILQYTDENTTIQ